MCIKKEDTGNKIIFSFHEQFAINQNHHQGLFIIQLLSDMDDLVEVKKVIIQ